MSNTDLIPVPMEVPGTGYFKDNPMGFIADKKEGFVAAHFLIAALASACGISSALLSLQKSTICGKNR